MRSFILLITLALGACGSVEQGSLKDSVKASPAVVLVTGATGRQGGAVARLLIKRGFKVRGLTRNTTSERANALSQLGIEMWQGDFDDPLSLRTAMRGADAVFGVTDFWEHGYEREMAHGRALVDAAEAEGVSHFVFSSVANADQETGLPHFDSKHEIEEYLELSGIGFTIFAPVSFMENTGLPDRAMPNGVVLDPMDPESPRQLISVEDIAFFVAEALENPAEWNGRRLDIASDELTGNQMVSLFAQLTGKDVRYERMPWEDLEAIAGEEITLMNRWIDETGYSADIAELRARYPKLKRFEDYLRENGWAQH